MSICDAITMPGPIGERNLLSLCGGVPIQDVPLFPNSIFYPSLSISLGGGHFRLWRIFIIFYLSPLGAGILSHAMYKNNTTHSYVEGEDINPQRYVTEYRTSYVEYTKTWQLSEDKSGTGQATIFFWYV